MTLVTGIEIFPLGSLTCPSGPEGAVVVELDVVVVLGVDVDVEVEVELEVVVVVLDVEAVDVESVLVDVESASTLNGPAEPALAK